VPPPPEALVASDRILPRTGHADTGSAAGSAPPWSTEQTGTLLGSRTSPLCLSPSVDAAPRPLPPRSTCWAAISVAKLRTMIHSRTSLAAARTQEVDYLFVLHRLDQSLHLPPYPLLQIPQWIVDVDDPSVLSFLMRCVSIFGSEARLVSK